MKKKKRKTEKFKKNSNYIIISKNPRYLQPTNHVSCNFSEDKEIKKNKITVKIL